MKAIDRYLLKQIIPTVLVTLFIAAVILCMERLMRLLDIAVGNGVSTLVVFQMLSNLIPHYIGLALPMALFLGVLLAFRKLSLQSELDAIQSSGVGLARFIRSAMVFAALMAACNFILSGYIQPFSRYAYRVILFNITSGVIEQGIGEGIFMNLPNGYTLRVEQSRGSGRELFGVFAHKEDQDGKVVTLTAKRGELVSSGKGGVLTMRLFDGQRSEWDIATGQSTTLQFQVFDWPLDLADLVRFRGRGGDEQELTIAELLRTSLTNKAAGRFGPLPPAVPEDSVPALKLPPSAVDAEFHSRIIFTLSMVVLPLLAAPLGIMTRRAGRSFGLVLGLAVLVSYHKILEFSEAYASKTGSNGPMILWSVFICFCIGSTWLFMRTDKKAGATPLQQLEDFWMSLASRLFNLIRPRKAAA